MRSMTFALTVNCLSLLIAGCTNEENESSSSSNGSPVTAAAEPINENCPIMEGKVTPEGGTVQWRGQTIGFCCEGCSEKRGELSDDEKAEALAEANPELTPQPADAESDSAT